MKSLKSLIRQIVPPFLVERYRAFRRKQQQQVNRQKSVEEVFTDIYQQNKWGGAKGEFCSGSGSANEQIVAAYVECITRLAESEGFAGRAFVDLGCGDFRVGKQLLPLCGSYVGGDVVQPLVQRNQADFGNATTRFVHLNIVDDALPEGEVCFVRQVLQHLSNQQIAAVLDKLRQYRWVVITEHYPAGSLSGAAGGSGEAAIRPNLDKVHGGDIRLYDNSGVYLTEPPFNLPNEAVVQVLEVPAVSVGPGQPNTGQLSTDQAALIKTHGVLRTFLYKPTSG